MLRFLAFMLLPGILHAQTYNCKITSQFDATTSTSSVSYLAANASRRCLILENKDGTNRVYVKFGSSHSETEGAVLQTNSRWEMVIPSMQSIYLKAAGGTPVVGILEGK